jgi:hypothetical protein
MFFKGLDALGTESISFCRYELLILETRNPEDIALLDWMPYIRRDTVSFTRTILCFIQLKLPYLLD